MTVVRARTRSGARTGLRSVICGFTAVLALLATACGNNNFDVGTSVLTLTSTSSTPFASYIVTIDDIILTRQDGTPVQTLSVPERVDLTQYSSLAELLEAPPVGVGTYVSATITLDYTITAPIITVNVNGQAVPVSLVDTTGAAPTTQTLTIVFDPSNPMVVTKGTSALANLNIDLEASNSINYSTSPVTVTVKPFWAVNAKPVYNSPIRARGLFVVADANTGTFVFNVRPLHDLQSALGALTIHPDANTYYNVNGVTYTGAAGLAAVAKLQENTQIAVIGPGTAIGGLSGITPTFTATAVYAGTSLESTIADHITGVVSARSGNSLTIQGAELSVGNQLSTQFGAVTFANTATVSIGPSTIVSQDGVAVATPLDISAISVGQNIDVSGQSVVDPVTGNPVSLDATLGQVRLQSTTQWGQLISATAGSLALNLLSINNDEPAVFNFTGTGSNSGLDATAGSYAVNTGSIDESATPAGTLLKIDGFATAFGSAPPDFNATAVTPGTSVDSQVIIEWANGGAIAPFSGLSGSQLVVDLANTNLVGTTHVIRTGPTSVDLASLPAGFAISTVNVDPSTVSLAIGSLTAGIRTFSDPQAFAEQIQAVLAANSPINKLVAVGRYDATTNTFNASSIDLNAQ
jgi:hypothetical protein